MGILAILEVLRILTSDYQIKRGHCLIAFNGIAALRKVINTNISNVHPKFKHSDLLSATSKLLHNLPITITTQHVKGHQDKSTPFQLLPRLAQLNILTDMKAKIELDSNKEHSLDTLSFIPHKLAFPTIAYQNSIIREQINTTLYNNISDYKITNSWIKRNRITPTTDTQIAWKAQEKALNSSSIGHRRFICKWVADITPTGKNMKEWKMRFIDQCSFCYNPIEDRDRILRWPNKDSVNIWNKAIKNFDS